MKAVCMVLAWLILLQPLVSFAQEMQQKPNEQQASQDVAAGTQSLDTYEIGLAMGRASAGQNYNGGGWFAGGILGGLVLGLIGAGIMVAVSQGSKDPPVGELMALSHHSEHYKMGYSYGYNRAAKSKALTNSLIGGVLGTAVVVAIVLGSQSH